LFVLPVKGIKSLTSKVALTPYSVGRSNLYALLLHATATSEMEVLLKWK